MKPHESRSRVIIEAIEPQVNAGRYPAKRVLGDRVTVTAAIFADGHDHIAARLLFRHATQRRPARVHFTALPNDLWTAAFPVDKLGLWHFTIEAWVDHFDTWLHDLDKRLAAQPGRLQPDPRQPTQQVGPQDIPLALRIGANHIEAAAARAKGPDARALAAAAAALRSLADANHSLYTSPITPALIALMAKHPDRSLATKYPVELPLWVDRERAAFSAWYELFPRSCSPTQAPAANKPAAHGTLRDVIARLPEIAAMGFDIVYLPPIHPIGLAFRKGPNNSITAAPGDEGSPWAIGSPQGGHTALHPKLGSFADFDALVAAAHAQSMELALDIAFQCSPDHPWVTEHPGWFTHRPDGTIQYAENPPKKYQDIYPLNFESADWRALWDALHDVFQFWIDRGVRVFRVDNPHTKALPFWEWCLAKLQQRAPETLFLAEAFTRPRVMYSLAKAGFTQSYTYFTWRNTKSGLEEYFTEICNPPVSDFFRPNAWPNTPDILHEQFQIADAPLGPGKEARRAVFRQRVILAATLSSNFGIYGPAYELCEGRAAGPSPGKTGSEEYLDSEKYQVRHWDRTDPISIAPLLTRLNEVRHANPALQRNANLHFHTIPNPQLLCYSKSTARFTDADNANTILTIVNLDPLHEHTAMVDLSLDKLGLLPDEPFTVEDLLTGARYTWLGPRNYIALTPAATAHIFRIVPAITAP